LDLPQIHPLSQEIGGATVAEGVRVHLLSAEAGPLAQSGNDASDSSAGERLAPLQKGPQPRENVVLRRPGLGRVPPLDETGSRQITKGHLLAGPAFPPLQEDGHAVKIHISPPQG
jgi:hypothetical protein